MTEKEAWLLLATGWQPENLLIENDLVKGTINRIHSGGLCFMAMKLFGFTDMARDMEAKIVNARTPHNEVILFNWPLTHEGAAERVKFCLEQASKL